ncbi:MAG: glycosyltransferase family 2 protein [Candidatus Nomurabacteria bacterium]|nr:glycosyltransferase family 2 protein [Candidatus Nomurabacteria bacterium]
MEDLEKLYTSSKIFVVIPVYNESAIIQSVITEIQLAGYKNIIIIDDGSMDSTYEQVSKNDVIVVRHYLNRGKGATLRTGIEVAKMLKADVVVTIDGDGQHNPNDIKKMLYLIWQGNDVVLGSRLFNSKGMPIFKIIANYFGNLCTWILCGLWVSDSQSGFRAYSKKAIAMINTRAERYEYDSEIIREIYRNKLKFFEIQIEVRYTNYSINKVSKMNIKNGLDALFKMIIY